MRNLIKSLVLMGLIGAGGSAYGQTELPQKCDQFGRPLIPVYVGDDFVGDFLFDTVAKTTIMPAKFLSDERLTPQDHTRVNHLSSAGFLKMPAAWVEDMNIAGVAKKRRVVGLNQVAGTQNGLIGLDYFLGHIVHFQGKGKPILLHGNNGAFADDDWKHIPGRYTVQRSISVPVRYAGIDLHVIFATGNSVSMINRATAYKIWRNQGKKGSAPGWSGDARYQKAGLFDKVRELAVFTLEDFKLGDIPVGDIEATTAVIDSLPFIGRKEQHILMLGADMIDRFEWAFDTRNHDILIKARN